MTESTHLRLELRNGVLVAQIKAESLSEYESGVVLREIEAHAPQAGWNVVLDMAEVRFMASSGIGMIISLMKSCKANKGKLAVCSITDEILSVLRLTKVDKLFNIRADVDNAIKTVC